MKPDVMGQRVLDEVFILKLVSALRKKRREEEREGGGRD
jgi:hypothetical protein